MNDGFQFLTGIEIDDYEELFLERTKEEKIHFSDFKEIVMNSKRLNRHVCIDLLDKVKRKIKDRYPGMVDSELTLSILYMLK
jgi:hypothetical protein